MYLASIHIVVILQQEHEQRQLGRPQIN
jgi:hypothetical protein